MQAERRTSAFSAFSFEAIRRSITARHFKDALAAAIGPLLAPDAAGNEVLLEIFGSPVAALAAVSKQSKERTAGRPGRPAVFYAKFALRYHDVEQDPLREAGASTREILAEHYHKPVTTIGKWIRIARQQGFLTPGVRGRRGGMATKVARELIKRSQQA
jgi:hypothetical protein